MNPSVPAATPTVGAAIGGIASMFAVSHVGGDPVVQGAVATLVPALFAWLAHKFHAAWLAP